MSTDPILDRSDWISEARFYDIDAQAAQYCGYDQQYQQLSRGPFEGRFRSFTFGDDLSIHFETANRELAQSALTPKGRYGVCLLAETSPPCAVNAATLAQNHVALCPENNYLEGKTPEGYRIYCMNVSSALLPNDGYNMQVVGVVNDGTIAARLRDLVQTGLANFSALGSINDYSAAVQNFKSSLADLLWQSAVQKEDKGGRGIRRHTHTHSRTLQVFRRAREYIHHSMADGISIVALCRDTGVSRRSLEGVFRSVVGMGPGNYIRVLQLNRMRRDLISDTSGSVSIGIIAARHGIWHWSRFSRYYQSLFGELPSHTRLRHHHLGTRRRLSNLTDHETGTRPLVSSSSR